MGDDCPTWILGIDLCGKAVEKLVIDTEEVLCRIQGFVKSLVVQYVGVLSAEEFDFVVNDLYKFVLISDGLVKRIKESGDVRKVDVGHMIKEYVDSIETLIIRYSKTLLWRQLMVASEQEKKTILAPVEYICQLPQAVKTIYDNYQPQTCSGHYSSVRQLGLQMALIGTNRLKEECHNSQPPLSNWQQLAEWTKGLEKQRCDAQDAFRVYLGPAATSVGNGSVRASSGVLMEAEKQVRVMCDCLETHRQQLLLFASAFSRTSQRWIQLLEGTEPQVGVTGGYADYQLRVIQMRDDTTVVMARMEVQVISKLREGALELRRARLLGKARVSESAVVGYSLQLVEWSVLRWFQIYLEWVQNFVSRNSYFDTTTYESIADAYLGRMRATRRAVACHAPELGHFFAMESK